MSHLQQTENVVVLFYSLHLMPINRNENIASQNPWLLFNGYIQGAGTEADRLSMVYFIHIADKYSTHKGERNQILELLGHKLAFNTQPGANHTPILPQISDDRLNSTY